MNHNTNIIHYSFTLLDVSHRPRYWRRQIAMNRSIETIGTSVSRIRKPYDSPNNIPYSQLEWKALPTLQLQRQ